MAEFQEVMLHAKRMCDSFSECNNCPLLSLHTHECRLREIITMIYGSNSLRSGIANIESIVMDWSKKNPTPRYPSFKEHALAVFPAIAPMFMISRCVCELFGDQARAPRCDGHIHITSCEDCWKREIPAKIAKEVGAEKKQRTEE